jgi:hypothetical protein
MNQPDGFDCPGCARPDPKHGSSFEFCENGAKAGAAKRLLLEEQGRLAIGFSLSEGILAGADELLDLKNQMA